MENIFRFHPKKISCDEHECFGDCKLERCVSGGYWCSKCLGNLNSAVNLFVVINPSISFAEIPIASVIYIRKCVEDIDYNDFTSLSRVKKFLDYDKMKVECLKKRIDNADQRIQHFVKIVTEEKNFNTNLLDSLLNERGGNIRKILWSDR